ncbi:MAG: hypothetical protein JWP27_1905 [Flaviaesturariibacter sp.]|nr:hypothetical protein [Flaviaesturariibacter sp.]
MGSRDVDPVLFLHMATPFLTASWQNLLMANYAVDPSLLQPHLPAHTELDSFDGVHYASLVGFLFSGTRVAGIPIPFHKTFEEVNLRFYVRSKQDHSWKRGVVFVKEIVPRHMITLVANTLYGENYATHAMRHRWEQDADTLHVSYEWKVGDRWNFLRADAEPTAQPVAEGSIEEFITEHYWGYTTVNKDCTGTYEVSHPRWKAHRVSKFECSCSVEALYGAAFAEPLRGEPASVFLAEGSAVKVMKGTRIYSPAKPMAV